MAVFFIMISIGCYILIKKTDISLKLPKALSKLFMFIAYALICKIGFRYGFLYKSNISFEMIMANIIVFGFLGGYMWFAIKKQDISLFKRNTFLLEIWIFILFASVYENLFMSGIGFILGGLTILGMIKVLKKTSKFIQNMEAFNE